MSDLTPWETRKLERFLGMATGYVLNFTNRTFSEFVRYSTGHDIYSDLYRLDSGSKANRLRAFWHTESNDVVGKLLDDLLNYSEAKGAEIESCRLIALRLRRIHSSAHTPNNGDEAKLSEHHSRLSQSLRGLKDELDQLARNHDRSNAGLALEDLPNQLFELYGLKPRQPFRVVGEQIDGSFEVDGNIYLLESKWERQPLPEADLLVFRGKIEGKSTFTRGVLVSLNDVSAPASDAITRGKAPCFFVMNGYDLRMLLGEALPLPDYLRRRVRLLAEEGRMFVPFSELQS